MTIWFLGAYAIVVTLLAISKCRRCTRYKKTINDLDGSLARKSLVIDSYKRRIYELDSMATKYSDRLNDYMALCKYGWHYLTTQTIENEDDNKGRIEVIGTTNRDADMSVVIKVFEFDKELTGDREFAEREAKELIDKIYE